MIVDGQLFFEPLTGTAITASAASTNVLDLIVGRDLGGGHYPDPEIVVSVLTPLTSGSIGTTLNIQIQGAPDNGSGSPGGYVTMLETGTIGLGQLVAGMQVRWDLNTVSQLQIPPVNTTFTAGGAGNSITVAANTNIQEGMNAVGTNIVPGAVVTNISGTTITLAATGITNSVTGAVATSSPVSFVSGQPYPRFLRLNYVVASGPFTGGTIWAGIVLDNDQTALYKPGFTWPAGA